MSIYHIYTSNQRERVESTSGYVTSATGSLDWAISLPFKYLLNYSERKGWKVEPVIEWDDEHPMNLEFRGIKYTLYWRGERLVSILKNNGDEEVEITYSQLPVQLKGLV
jgi:hypothetical protein